MLDESDYHGISKFAQKSVNVLLTMLEAEAILRTMGFLGHDTIEERLEFLKFWKNIVASERETVQPILDPSGTQEGENLRTELFNQTQSNFEATRTYDSKAPKLADNSMEVYINDDNDDCEIPTEREDDHSITGAINTELDIQQIPSMLSKLSVGSVE